MTICNHPEIIGWIEAITLALFFLCACYGVHKMLHSDKYQMQRVLDKHLEMSLLAVSKFDLLTVKKSFEREMAMYVNSEGYIDFVLEFYNELNKEL